MDPILINVLIRQPRRRCATSDAGRGAVRLLRSPRARKAGARIDGTGASPPASAQCARDAW